MHFLQWRFRIFNLNFTEYERNSPVTSGFLSQRPVTSRFLSRRAIFVELWCFLCLLIWTSLLNSRVAIGFTCHGTHVITVMLRKDFNYLFHCPEKIIFILVGWHNLFLPGALLLLLKGLTLIPVWKVITCPVKCVVKLLFHLQTSVVQPLKFGNG